MDISKNIISHVIICEFVCYFYRSKLNVFQFIPAGTFFNLQRTFFICIPIGGTCTLLSRSSSYGTKHDDHPDDPQAVLGGGARFDKVGDLTVPRISLYLVIDAAADEQDSLSEV